jgi:hypothetical protein
VNDNGGEKRAGDRSLDVAQTAEQRKTTDFERRADRGAVRAPPPSVP